MDRKLLIKRLEIVLAVLLIVIIFLGVMFFAFRAIPVTDQPLTNSPEELLPGIPANTSELIKFLDINGKKEFLAAGEKVVLPGDDVVSSAYNNTSLSQFDCTNQTSSDCTVYEILNGGRIFYISAPIVLKLREPTAAKSVKKTLLISGEEVELTYTQRVFVNATTDEQGNVTDSTEDLTLAQVEEIYGCLTSNVCFNSGRLSTDKATNDLDVAAFEQFVQAVTQ